MRRVDIAGSLEDLVGISTVIKRATERSVKIVQNLRNFSRVSGEPVPTDLHVGIEETLMLLAPRLRQANIQVERRFGQLPPVMCRAGEMNQVFMNLLVNAIQALEQGENGEGRVVIETRVDGEMAEVSVTDNGPGVPDQISHRIFDPLFTRKEGGRGMGLTIARQLVESHGGRIHLLLDGRRRGANFEILLPRKRSPATIYNGG